MEPVSYGGNIAQGDARVGVQAQAIYGGVHLSTDMPAAQKYSTGKARLEQGSPREAEQLIGDAIEAGCHSNEVLYHRALAVLRDRSIDQLDESHVRTVRVAARRAAGRVADTWSQALEVIDELIAYLCTVDGNGSGEQARLKHRTGALRGARAGTDRRNQAPSGPDPRRRKPGTLLLEGGRRVRTRADGRPP